MEQVERAAFSGVSHFFSFSRHVAADLASHYGVNPERIHVVGTGPGWIKPVAHHGTYENGRVLFVGKDRFEEKGGPLLLDAFQLAARSLEAISLTVVGPVPRRYRAADTRISFLGRLPPGHELASLFRDSSLFAMPSLVEPWGMVWLEALACGTPVLGLRRQAFPETVEDGRYGFMVDEPTPEVVAETLVQALSDPGRLQRMGEEGQRHVTATYSWERVADTIAEAIGSQGS